MSSVILSSSNSDEDKESEKQVVEIQDTSEVKEKEVSNLLGGVSSYMQSLFASKKKDSETAIEPKDKILDNKGSLKMMWGKVADAGLD